MAFVQIQPEFAQLLARQGSATAADMLALPGVVCCGHPDRNVSRVTVGGVVALLKREHRTRWRDRLANLVAGFGWSSKSIREFNLLRELQTTGIGCPEPMAAGEDDAGRAFLLLREADDYEDIRQVMRKTAPMTADQVRLLAQALGTALARLHIAGFEHGDLYSKHVLVRGNGGTGLPALCFLDWQRSRRRRHVAWSKRWRDLAALNATLADELATPRQRLRLLHAYLRYCRTHSARVVDQTLASATCEIHRRSLRLLQRRRIREMRRPPLAAGTQRLIWLDGEALQVTPEFRDEIGSVLKKGTQLFSATGPRPRVEKVPLPGTRWAELVSRWAHRPGQWLWSWLRRQPMVAPEVESMKVIFHLQRYGVVLPRLLAAGQKSNKPWEMQSFLLTEPLQGAVPLRRFLAAADGRMRRRVMHETGNVLRQMHAGNCHADWREGAALGEMLAVCGRTAGNPTVALTTVHGIEKCRHPNPVRVQRDLAALAEVLAGVCSRGDLLRGLLSYIDQPRLTPAAKRFVRRVLRRVRPSRHRGRVAA